MGRARIVKAGCTEHTKTDFAAHRLDAAYQGMGAFDLLDRHEIRDLRDSLRGEKARQEDVRVRQIELFWASIPKPWRNLKPPTLVVIEKDRKDSWGIEVWQGTEIDRTIHADQGYGIKISNYPVIFNGLIPSGWYIDHAASPMAFHLPLAQA